MTAGQMLAARACVFVVFLAIGAVSQRRESGFAVVAGVGAAWLVGSSVLLADDARRGLFRGVVVGDAVFVLAALLSTGDDHSDLRFAVAGLPAAWAMWYLPRAMAVAAPGAMVVCLATLSRGFTRDIWGRDTAVFVLAYVGTTALAYLGARQANITVGRVVELENDRRALLETALSGEERDRRHFSAALHDDSLQFLLSASQDLEELEVPDHQREILAATARAVQHSRDNLLQIMRAMHPVAVFTGDLRAVLRQLCQARARPDLRIELDVAETAMGHVDELAVAVITQLLDNAVRHARASTVRVRIVGGRSEGRVSIHVQDDGVGFAAETLDLARARGRSGLALAQERIQAAGGRWQLTAVPGHGVDVRITFLLPDRRVAPAVIDGDGDGDGDDGNGSCDVGMAPGPPSPRRTRRALASLSGRLGKAPR